MRHQRIHQKARHGKLHGKDSDRDERAEEDSEGESTHSGEQEAEAGHVAITRSRREGLASATKDCSHCGEKAGAGRAPREQASAGDPGQESPAALGQDLLELCTKRPARPVLATDSASQVLGLE